MAKDSKKKWRVTGLPFKLIVAGALIWGFSLSAANSERAGLEKDSEIPDINHITMDLCITPDLKYVMSQEQVTQMELTDILMSISGLKLKPDWPKDTSKLNDKEYYQLEAKTLVKNGLPAIFLELSPGSLVDRRFFSSLMFDIAIQGDRNFQKDCSNAGTEASRTDCLFSHDYIFSAGAAIYRDEIITVLCQRKDIIKKLGRSLNSRAGNHKQ